MESMYNRLHVTGENDKQRLQAPDGTQHPGVIWHLRGRVGPVPRKSAAQRADLKPAATPRGFLHHSPRVQTHTPCSGEVWP